MVCESNWTRGLALKLSNSAACYYPGLLPGVIHVNGWFPGVYMSYNLRESKFPFVSRIEFIRSNFLIFLFMHPGSLRLCGGCGNFSVRGSQLGALQNGAKAAFKVATEPRPAYIDGMARTITGTITEAIVGLGYKGHLEREEIADCVGEVRLEVHRNVGSCIERLRS